MMIKGLIEGLNLFRDLPVCVVQKLIRNMLPSSRRNEILDSKTAT